MRHLNFKQSITSKITLLALFLFLSVNDSYAQSFSHVSICEEWESVILKPSLPVKEKVQETAKCVFFPHCCLPVWPAHPECYVVKEVYKDPEELVNYFKKCEDYDAEEALVKTLTSVLNPVPGFQATPGSLVNIFGHSIEHAKNFAKPLDAKTKADLKELSKKGNFRYDNSDVDALRWISANHWAAKGLKPTGGYDAITYYDLVIVKDAFLAGTDCDDLAKWAHELVHVDQYRDLGWNNFLFRYLKEGIEKGYANISFEKEAKRIEGEVCKALISDFGCNAETCSITKSSTAPLPGNTYIIESKLGTKVLDIYKGSKDNMGNLHLYRHKGGTNQQFEIVSTGNNSLGIKNVGSKRFLDIQFSKFADGTNIIQYEPNGSIAQQFIVQAAGNGYFRIKSKHDPRYCIEVEDGRYADGANIQLAPITHNADEQLFKFKLLDGVKRPISSGYYSCNDGGHYYIRQVGNDVYWFGEHPNGNWANVFKGKLNGNKLTGSYHDVPKGRMTGRGEITLEVGSDGKSLKKISGAFGGSSFTKAKRPDRLPGSRRPGYSQARNINDMDGLWKCNDGAKYYIREIGGKIIWFGEGNLNANGIPGFANVGVGTRSGNTIRLDWMDIPKCGMSGKGQLTLRINSADEIVKTGGSGFGGSKWTRSQKPKQDRLICRWGGKYLHTEYGKPELTTDPKDWHSAMWEMIPVQGTKYFRLRCRWGGRYLHTERGKPELTTDPKDWHSAMWKFEDVF